MFFVFHNCSLIVTSTFTTKFAQSLEKFEIITCYLHWDFLVLLIMVLLLYWIMYAMHRFVVPTKLEETCLDCNNGSGPNKQ